MSLELSGAALYQQYLFNNRRNFSVNQRARLNEYIAGITRRGGPNTNNVVPQAPRFNNRNFNTTTQTTFIRQPSNPWIPLPQQSRMPLGGRPQVFPSGSINRTTRYPVRIPSNYYRPTSFGQGRFNNFNNNVLNNDVSLDALNRSRDPVPYLVTNQEWFMTVYANNDGKDSVKTTYKPIHPANIRSTRYLCAAFSQWRIRRFSLTFHSYLPMTEVATIFAGLSYDYHSSRPKGRDIASLKPSVNFTTSDRTFLVLDSDRNLPQELYSTDQEPDLHETVRNLYPGGILTDGVYLVAGQNPPNHEVGYWDIDYEIEFLHPRSDSTPQKDSVVFYDKDDDDSTIRSNKFFCISRKSKDEK